MTDPTPLGPAPRSYPLPRPVMSRTAAEILADWDATQPPPYPVSPTPEHVRVYDLGWADYHDRLAELYREVVALPSADQPRIIVASALHAAARAARELAAERRRWHEGEGNR